MSPPPSHCVMQDMSIVWEIGRGRVEWDLYVFNSPHCLSSGKYLFINYSIQVTCLPLTHATFRGEQSGKLN